MRQRTGRVCRTKASPQDFQTVGPVTDREPPYPACERDGAVRHAGAASSPIGRLSVVSFGRPFGFINFKHVQSRRAGIQSTAEAVWKFGETRRRMDFLLRLTQVPSEMSARVLRDVKNRQAVLATEISRRAHLAVARNSTLPYPVRAVPHPPA
jgi:hypothetical protein